MSRVGSHPRHSLVAASDLRESQLVHHLQPSVTDTLSICDGSIMLSHYHLGLGCKIQLVGKFCVLYLSVHSFIGASIKRPITIPESTFDYLTVLSMPQVSFEVL